VGKKKTKNALGAEEDLAMVSTTSINVSDSASASIVGNLVVNDLVPVNVCKLEKLIMDKLSAILVPQKTAISHDDQTIIDYNSGSLLGRGSLLDRGKYELDRHDELFDDDIKSVRNIRDRENFKSRTNRNTSKAFGNEGDSQSDNQIEKHRTNIKWEGSELGRRKSTRQPERTNSCAERERASDKHRDEDSYDSADFQTERRHGRSERDSGQPSRQHRDRSKDIIPSRVDLDRQKYRLTDKRLDRQTEKRTSSRVDLRRDEDTYDKADYQLEKRWKSNY
jgi:hypothetical protein